MEIKGIILAICGFVGGAASAVFGGWNAALTTLCIFMAGDYISGLVVAGIFKQSPHSKNGALESRAGLKGLFRKCAMLFFVLIACRLDIVLGVNFIKDGVVTAFICNEVISIVENAGLMGVPMPPVITRAIEILKKKADDAGAGEDE